MEEERKTKEIPKGKHGGYRPGAGRKPKSLSAVQKLSDKRDLDAFLNTGSTLKPPDYLGDVAKVKWNELIASYQKMKIEVNILDLTQLVLYVQSYERYQKAQETWIDMLKKSIAVADEDTDKLIRRCVKIMQDETSIMTKLAPDLLLTPAGRAKFIAKNAIDKSGDNDSQTDSLGAFFSQLGAHNG